MSQGYHPLEGTDLLGDSWQTLNATDEALATDFSGPTAPTITIPYMRWADTTSGFRKERNAANDDWIIVGLVGVAYSGLLPISGGMMAGTLNMGGNPLTNLGQGSGTAAARVQEMLLKADLAAPAFTGNATVNQAPAGNSSLVRRDWAMAQFLGISGGTLTGALVLNGNASSALHAVPLQQLEDCVTFDLSTGHRHDGSDSRVVRGINLSSALSPTGNATLGQFLAANGSGASSWATLNKSGLVALGVLAYVDITGISAYDPVDYLLTGVSDIAFLPVLTRDPDADLSFLGLVKKTAGLYATMQGAGSARFYYYTS